MPFVTRHPQPGSHVATDARQGSLPITKAGFAQAFRSQRTARKAGEDPNTLLPGVHRTASPFERWVFATHQNAVGSEHLQANTDEFAFHFDRPRSRSPGHLFYRAMELAVGHAPATATTSPIHNREARPQRHQLHAPDHRAYNPPTRIGRGGRPSETGTIRWIAQTPLMVSFVM